MTQPQTSITAPELDADGLLARQAILDEKMSVVGYALLDRSGRAPGPARDADFLMHALSLASSTAVADKLTLFLRCSHETLASPHLELVSPERLVLEIALPPAVDAERIAAVAAQLKAARDKGFRLAFDHQALAPAWASWLAHASFVRLDLERLPAGVIEPVLKHVARLAMKNLKVIASGVETREQHASATALGVRLFQGQWFARPVLVRNQPVRAQHANILQLIHLLRNDGELEQIEEVLKRDPLLSLNLLRLVNAASNGLRHEVTSFRQATMLLGLQKLTRWAALMLAASGEGGSPALARIAATRGRLAELLVGERLDEKERDQAFVVGIFSLLDAITGQPLEAVLETVKLPGPVNDALLHRSGPFAPYLDLIEACESADEESFARAALVLGLSNHDVNMAHLQALAWAENMLS